MQLLTVIGARPQFIKAAIVSRALSQTSQVREVIVHTGQHYDQRMSEVFFDELGIPQPARNLGVGSGPHGQQTGRMLADLEALMLEDPPDAVLVYGDTNSTLAGALAAAKLNIPVVHVEAGLRSFNRVMPEEVNRVLTDHVSRLLLCPTESAVANLATEGVTQGVHLVGDVMYDAALHFAQSAATRVDPLAQYNLQTGQYVLMTCHRAENTDDAVRLNQILEAASQLAERLPVVWPVHPRTKSRIVARAGTFHAGLKLIEPATYLEMVELERNAALILTDSGGVQKEAFFFEVPCVTMRDETEWVETVDCGANRLAGASRERILQAANDYLDGSHDLTGAEKFYGGGNASKQTARLIEQLLSETGSITGSITEQTA